MFNPTNNTFQNYVDWDYLEILKINKKNKQILSEQDGNVYDSVLYQVRGTEIKEIGY